MVASGLIISLGAMVIFVLLSGSNPADHALSGTPEGVRIEPIQGSLAPDFSLRTSAGETFSLSNLRGRPVLINFWATWCGPCRIEMPFLQSRYETFREQGLVILAINFNEAPDVVRAYGEELGLTFPLLLDPGAEIQSLYRNRSYPTSFFVDREGVIKVQQIGVMTEGQLDEHLGRLGLGT